MSFGKRPKDCQVCGEPIVGDIMRPVGEGPMHADCWTEWMTEQKSE